jgi:hypothetical protein
LERVPAQQRAQRQGRMPLLPEQLQWQLPGQQHQEPKQWQQQALLFVPERKNQR